MEMKVVLFNATVRGDAGVKSKPKAQWTLKVKILPSE
jgi:hypothetical protein